MSEPILRADSGRRRKGEEKEPAHLNGAGAQCVRVPAVAGPWQLVAQKPTGEGRGQAG